jgi:hypothetical protein
MRPLIFWIVGIALLVILLVVRGGLRGPTGYVLLVVFAVALIAGFVFFNRGANR